jgi:hydrogenase maturation protease
MTKILILGLGNILMADDGVGVRVVERLRKKYRFPRRVGLVDGGIRGLALLPHLEGVRRLLVVDAVESSKGPGRLTRLIGEEVLPLQPRRMFQHQDGLAELLFAARSAELCPEEVVVWGVVPAVVTPGPELSIQVASRLDDLVDRVVEELQRWGVTPQPKESLTNP